MSEPLFRQIGPYEIRREIGRGGMAMVFLAADTRADGRLVALKVLPDGPGEDLREIAQAERRGAELQQQFLATSGLVPEVYEVGTTEGYLYIAMEYLDGEDLSAIIRRGPVEPTRATHIATQLCQFLEEIDHLAVSEASALTLLHNDLKPTNIRLVAGDGVKVLDFGAAKALSMSRRVTRNDFYSTPYLSPECLDSGERDRQTDAWALGVIWYEMVAGVAPFRAHDTRRLEDRIRSRRPPPPPPNCPAGLQAVIFKLLAPRPEDRYADAGQIREDLERFVGGTETRAEALVGGGLPSTSLRPGQPAALSAGLKPGDYDSPDEPPTRKIPALVGGGLQPAALSAGLKPGGYDSPDEPPTRKIPDGPDEPPTRKVPRVVAQELPVAAPASVPARARKRPAWLVAAVLVILLTPLLNESCVYREARRAAATVPTQEFDGLNVAWDQYERLRNRSYLGFGARDLGQALRRQALILADRVAANYRTPTPTVREAQWMAAAKALERALSVVPNDAEVRGALRYAQGHLRRIDGEADKSRRMTASAQRNFAEAVSAFREAASLRPNWPDPFLGLSRTFTYGLDDVERGADAMNQAQKLGHAISPRETAQLADGYAAQSETLNRASSEVRGMPQEKEFLTRSRDACQKALELYSAIPDFLDVPAHIRVVQRRLEVVERKLAEIDGQLAPAETGLGRLLLPLVRDALSKF